MQLLCMGQRIVVPGRVVTPATVERRCTQICSIYNALSEASLIPARDESPAGGKAAVRIHQVYVDFGDGGPTLYVPPDKHGFVFELYARYLSATGHGLPELEYSK